MKSRIFSTDRYRTIGDRTKELLNSQEDFLSPTTARSTRAFGDAVEAILGERFQEMLGEDCAEYSASFARRAMADLAFRDNDNVYYVVDVKTHREDTHFNMPNLTSVERLARFYEDDANYFVLLLVKYRLVGTHAMISDVTFVPIEFLDWNCLTIGALGWGQIQIANSNHVAIRPHYSRKAWMLELCNVMFEFYPREIEKIASRIEYFQKVRQRWEAKEM
ncbi:MAG TPA: hypothetical protein DD670_16405 [Planctomycetaceae bacterium]|nr:hypothetical protein [Planctomycetaceae bacterium]